jgi:hypothetical protein
MAVTDLRTLIDDGTDNTNWVDVAGSATGNNNAEVFPPGASASVSDKVSKAINGLLYDTGGTGNFAAGDHLYLWYSFLFGALDTVGGGGVRIRVTGATVTDWAEVYIDGNDSGKSGWQLAVVSLDALLANPDGTNGTPPTATQVQRVGVVFDVTATVGGNNDNVAVQGVWRSPSSLTAAYRIDAGTDATPNTWQDLVDDSLSNALGIVVQEPNGAITLRAPIVFGPDPGGGSPNAASTFEDTGVVLAWDLSTGLIEPNFYKLTVEAGTGDVRVTAGTKLGTGETAVGVNGWTIITGGPRWRLDFEDADQDDIQFYGCSFTGSGPLTINDAAVEVISCVFSNCDFIEMTGGATGPTLLSNFFQGAPGPKAQVVFTSGVTPTDGQFDFNSFANMDWFAIEIPSATTQFDLRGVTFSSNGTNRDVLLSHTTGDIQLNVLEGGDTPGVTNGATITVTMTGTCDILAVMAGTWSNALGTETNDLGTQGTTLVTQTTASLAVDDDTFAMAAAVPGPKFLPDKNTITYSGASDQYEDSNVLEVPSTGGGLIARQGSDEVTAAAATRTGFPVHALIETESVQGIVHVDAAAGGTAVVNLDALTVGSRPQLRPWQVVENASTITISYGAGNGDATKGTVNNNRFVYVAVVALDGTAANTAVSTIVLNRSGGTSSFTRRSTSFPQQDDNVGTTGRSLELDVFDYDVDTVGQDLDQGTYDVNNNVTVTVTGLTEGATVTMIAEAGGDLAEGTVIGTFPVLAGSNGQASSSHSYTNPQPVSVRARYSGAPIAAVQEDNGTGNTNYTTESNDSTANNVILMPTTEALNDAFYVGMLDEFSELLFTINSGQGRAGTWSVTWEYWNGSSWASLAGVTDGSNSFATTGCPAVSWTIPGDWSTTTVSGTGVTTTALYYVRARISSFTSAGAGPTATKIRGNPTKYLPFTTSTSIESTGLSIPAIWVPDTIAT